MHRNLFSSPFLAASLAASLVVGLAACAPELPADPAPRTVHPVWDPTNSVLPTPTDLARDEATGRLDLPIDGEISGAEADFRVYLNGLDGYPLSSTLTIPMSGDVRPETLDGAVILHDLDTDQAVELDVRWDEASQTIVANPTGEDTLEPGRRYAFGLWGYDSGAEGADGAQIVADAGFYLLRTERPLTEHITALPGANRAEKLEAAETLETLKSDYERYFDALATRGVPRERLAVVSGFTTTSAPTFWFDPAGGKVPIPNSLLLDDETGLVSLPDDADDDEEARELKHALNAYDGFSTTGVLRLEATRPIRASSVTPSTFRLFRVVDGEVREDFEVERRLLDDGVTMVMRSELALEPSSEYVFVATDGILAGSGTPIGAQPLTALLRGRFPLVGEEGESQVSSLDDATAARLEAARQRAAPVVDRLVEEGVARTSLSAVVPFRTVSSLRRLLDVRAELYEREIPTDVRNVVNRTPGERGLGILFDVETVVTGDLVVWDKLDPRTRRFYEDGRGEERLVDFVLTIPEGYAPGEEIPVVLFGHGLFTSRELVYMVANRLADAGYAAFALDMPYHGRRTVCKETSDCVDGNTCDELGRCIAPDGSPGDLAMVSSPWPDGPEWPAVTGAVFVEPDNIVGSRDHFQQALADLLQGLRVIRGADWESASGGWTLDGDDVVYLGMSLGGILGSNVAAVEPTIETFVLNVPGANYFQMLNQSDAFATAFRSVLDRRDIEEGTDEYVLFETGVRWLLDPVDPVNTVQHAVLRPYTYTDPVSGEERESPVKRILIQMAEGDLVVPNSSTESLSRRSGVPIRTYTPLISNHAFLFDPTSLEGGRARTDMVEWFDAR